MEDGDIKAIAYNGKIYVFGGNLARYITVKYMIHKLIVDAIKYFDADWRYQFAACY